MSTVKSNARDILYNCILSTTMCGPEAAQKVIDKFEEQLCELEQLDGKFAGYVIRKRDHRVEEEFVVFVPRDLFLQDVLMRYWAKCKCNVDRVGHEQVDAVDRLLKRVSAWQETHKSEIKFPDAEPGECA